MSITEHKTIVGIDPGVKTGICIITVGKIVLIDTVTAVEAENHILMIPDRMSVFVLFEDCRLRAWKGKKGKEALKGVGSVERDCKRWAEFLDYHGIQGKACHPTEGKTKLSAEQFSIITGYKGRTSEHARDAAMLVFRRKFVARGKHT